MCKIDRNELLRRAEECRTLSMRAETFVRGRQFDELARKYRRLAAQVEQLQQGLRSALIAA
jgi:hypothetical protein